MATVRRSPICNVLRFSTRVAACTLVLFMLLVHTSSAATYVVRNDVPNTPGGQRFNREVGVSNMQRALQDAANFCRGRVFSLSPAKNWATVILIVDNYNGVAKAASSTIHLSAAYVQNTHRGDSRAIRREITGVVYHESAHVWQNIDNAIYGRDKVYAGLVEGIADFVRLRSELPATHWKRQRGGEWHQGYAGTAYFLDWIDRKKKANFVNLLNQRMGQAKWTPDFFRQITGKTVEALWREYQAAIRSG